MAAPYPLHSPHPSTNPSAPFPAPHSAKRDRLKPKPKLAKLAGRLCDSLPSRAVLRRVRLAWPGAANFLPLDLAGLP